MAASGALCSGARRALQGAAARACGDQWMQLACLAGCVPACCTPRALVFMSRMAYRLKLGRGPSPCSTPKRLPRGSHWKSTILSLRLGSSSTWRRSSPAHAAHLVDQL